VDARIAVMIARRKECEDRMNKARASADHKTATCYEALIREWDTLLARYETGPNA
jgi:hypothetical protein